MSEDKTGGCLCGAVTITVRGKLGPVSYCHCSQCRRQTGLYYATTDAALSEVEISGREKIGAYRASPDAERAFCRDCGSALYWRGDGEARISLMAGLFPNPTPAATCREQRVTDLKQRRLRRPAARGSPTLGDRPDRWRRTLPTAS